MCLCAQCFVTTVCTSLYQLVHICSNFQLVDWSYVTTGNSIIYSAICLIEDKMYNALDDTYVNVLSPPINNDIQSRTNIMEDTFHVEKFFDGLHLNTKEYGKQLTTDQIRRPGIYEDILETVNDLRNEL
ncbi:hypothetical protein I4U23_008368 [Adineta vaga]|nr:hypothetical protein I4U23_008368 [Adineta vaga]